jgi:hypothetical protein
LHAQFVQQAAERNALLPQQRAIAHFKELRYGGEGRMMSGMGPIYRPNCRLLWTPPRIKVRRRSFAPVDRTALKDQLQFVETAQNGVL